MPRLDRTSARLSHGTVQRYRTGIAQHKKSRRDRKTDARLAAVPPLTFREVGAAVVAQLRQWVGSIWRATARALGA